MRSPFNIDWDLREARQDRAKRHGRTEDQASELSRPA